MLETELLFYFCVHFIIIFSCEARKYTRETWFTDEFTYRAHCEKKSCLIFFFVVFIVNKHKPHGFIAWDRVTILLHMLSNSPPKFSFTFPRWRLCRHDKINYTLIRSKLKWLVRSMDVRTTYIHTRTIIMNME